jgi:hypothetical protein
VENDRLLDHHIEEILGAFADATRTTREDGEGADRQQLD